MAAVGESLMLERDIKRACELLEKLQRSGEVPAQKLAALQKVLQSEFCNAVREVYEHVYETVDISGSPDIRASATAKATVAAFAASEGHAHPRVVELPKTDEGLGFNVMGGQGTEFAHLHIAYHPRGVWLTVMGPSSAVISCSRSTV
ncbi:hypothetical protein MRX96_025654 [Rhipicephalus microplus]